MIRRPPRSTLFPYTDALPISSDAWRGTRRGFSCRYDTRTRGPPEQLDDRRVGLDRQPVHRGLAPPGDAVGGPGGDARLHQVPLQLRRVEEVPPGEARERRDDPLAATLRHAGHAKEN